MSFNKIKGMVSSVDDIEKSLENSDFLELSCDKQRVHRITDIRSKDNVDEYTIYVVSKRWCVNPSSDLYLFLIVSFKILGRLIAKCNTCIGSKSI